MRARPEAVISVDTYKSGVARAAIMAGAEVVNDVSAMQWDARMAQTCAQLECGVVLMHTRGQPRQWRQLPPETDVTSLVMHDLANRVLVAVENGVRREHIVLDPGFGFGKNFEQNYPLLAQFRELQKLQFPLLAGTSRKSFIGRTVEKRTGKKSAAAERLYGSLAAMVAAILGGVHIVRVHDVKPAIEAAAIADEILEATPEATEGFQSLRKKVERDRHAGGTSREDMSNLEKLAANPRVTIRRQGAPDAGGCGSVVYWMQRAQRALDNPALDVAVDAANALGQPVVIFFAPAPFYPHANLRHYTFLAQGIPDIAERARQRGIGFVLRLYPEHSLLKFCDEVKASLVIGDENPMREPERLARAGGTQADGSAVDGGCGCARSLQVAGERAVRRTHHASATAAAAGAVREAAT